MQTRSLHTRTLLTRLAILLGLSIPLSPAALAQALPTPPTSYTTFDLGSVGSGSNRLDTEGVALNGWGDVASGFLPFSDPYDDDGVYLWHQGWLEDLSPGYSSTVSQGGGFTLSGLNDAHQVIGDAILGPGDTGFASFLLQDGCVTYLGNLGTDTFGDGDMQCFALNRAGQVAGMGVAYDAQHNGEGGYYPFFWDRGQLTNLGVLGTDMHGHNHGAAVSLNDQAQVACTTELYDTTHTDLGPASFLWQNGVQTDLGSLGTGPGGVRSTAAAAINNAGLIVGTSDAYDAQHQSKGSRAFLWQNGVMTILGPLGTDSDGQSQSSAVAINDQGQVIGSSDLYDDTHTLQGTVACLWQNGVPTKLGVLSPPPGSGPQFSSAVAINNQGQVVGFFTAYSGGVATGLHPYVWQNGQMTDLSPFLPTDLSSETFIKSINDQGEIVLTATLESDTTDTHTFLLRPAGAHVWTATGIGAGNDGTRLLWNNVNGKALTWNLLADGTGQYGAPFTPPPGEGAQAIVAAPHGASQVLLAGANGHARVWTVGADGTVQSTRAYGPVPGGAVRSLAVDPAGLTRLLWTTGDGRAFIWTLHTDGTAAHSPAYGPAPHQHVKVFTVAPDGSVRLLWVHVAGVASVWTISGSKITKSPVLGPQEGWTAQGLGVGADGKTRLLWTHWDGRMRIDTLTSSGVVTVGTVYGPFVGWTAQAISVGADNTTKVLWKNVDGRIAPWSVGADGSVSYLPVYGPY